MRDQRAIATSCTIVPIFIGTRRRKRSHCGRPQVLPFHLMNTTATPPAEANISHQ